MNVRYEGKPFLELLESYVLDAIGALDPDDDATLTAMESEFHTMFGEPGTWRQIVEARMQFPDGMPGAINELWTKGRARFREAQGHEPDPYEFTRTFVDTKFPH